uniref:Uncharacterized protein n=1 Tax=Cynoglossus semilaevis TaxID=244447 RepID=A0A3P8VUD4_CYNSE
MCTLIRTELLSESEINQEKTFTVPTTQVTHLFHRSHLCSLHHSHNTGNSLYTTLSQ